MRRMNALNHFLREHAFVHRQTVAPGDFNMDYLIEGLSDSQLRSRSHGMNSIAWILWHITRVEDGFVSCMGSGLVRSHRVHRCHSLNGVDA
jgi:hypothetical protein